MNLAKEKLEDLYSGVYALFHQGQCIYVGKSKNVPYRLRQHIADHDRQSKDFDDFEIYYTQAREYLETYLIKKIKPFYNTLKNPSHFDGKPHIWKDPSHIRILRLVKQFVGEWEDFCKNGQCNSTMYSVYSMTGKRIYAE